MGKPTISIHPFRKKTFFRIFGYTFAITLIIITVAVLLFYYNIEQITAEQISLKAIDTLVQTRSVFESIHSLLVPAFLQFSFESSVSNLMYSPEPAVDDIAPALYQMNRIIAFYPWLHSVYIYNRSADRVFSTVSGAEDDFVTDLTLYSLLKTADKNDLFTYIPRKLNIDIVPIVSKHPADYQEQNVFTLLAADVFGKPDNIKAWIVFNLSESRIRRDFMPQFSITGSELLIVQDDGCVLSHPDPEQFNSSISDDPVFSRIRKTAEDKGYFLSEVQGINTLFSYVYYDTLKWYFISRTPYDDLFLKFRNVRNLSIVAFLALNALAVFLTLLISRRLYNPIDRLYTYAVQVSQRVKFGQADLGQESSSELQYLDTILKQTVRKVDLLNKYIEDHENLYANEVLKGLLEGNFEPDNAFADESVPDFIEKEGRLWVAALRLDDYRSFLEEFSGEEIRNVFTIIEAMVREKLDGSFLFIDMGRDHSVIISSCSSSITVQEAEAETTEQLKQVQLEMQKRYGKTITIGISEVVGTYQDLPQAYRRAVRATQYRFTEGHNSIILYSQITSKAPRSYEFPEEMVRLLLYEVRQCKPLEALEILDKILQNIRSYSYDDFNVMVQLFKYMALKMLFPHGNPTDFRLSDSWDKLNDLDHVETAVQMREQAEAAFAAYERGTNSASEQRKHEITDKIIKQVRNQISNPNLTQFMIAEQVGLSINYIRGIFKEILGVTLSTYISDERIKVTKELLSTTGLPVKEIYARAGFTNYSNFFTTFKRHTGLTPLEFRQNKVSEKSL